MTPKMTPARGEVWRYQAVTTGTAGAGLSTARLIVSANAINAAEQLPVVLALRVLDSDPGGLLSVELGDGLGWASALSIEPVPRVRLVERLRVLDAAVMLRVEQALRAAQAL